MNRERDTKRRKSILTTLAVDGACTGKRHSACTDIGARSRSPQPARPGRRACAAVQQSARQG